MEFFKALLFGILEGVTEWLPISSTGHLILLDRFLHLNIGGNISEEFADAFSALFEVMIQFGAVAAVGIRFFKKIDPIGRGRTRLERNMTRRLYGRLILSGIPAALCGIVLDYVLEQITGKDLDAWLFNGTTVAFMLILYGIFFLIPEKWLPQLSPPVLDEYHISAGRAFVIGCFQALSIVPGTSRSGATILGGMVMGLSRTVAAEYSFLLAIPTMTGASLLKMLRFASYVSESGVAVPLSAYAVLFWGMATAFFVSLFVLDFLLDFVKRHTFLPFGIYRILLGIAVLLGGR